MAAPPTPWTDRAAIRSAGVRDRPQASDDKVKTTSPKTKMRLRPKRSASVPWARMKADKLTE